jgi:hypothetical protein
MLPLPRRRTRRVSLLGIATLAAACPLPAPAAAGAPFGQPPSTESSLQTPEPEHESGPDESGPEPAAAESSPGTPDPELGRRRRRSRDGEAEWWCSVDLEASASVISPAAPVSFAGTLSCPEHVSAADQTVTLYEKAVRAPGFSLVASTSTETGGAFRFALPGPEITSAFYVRCDGGKSARVKIKVAVQVSIDAPVAGTQLVVGAGHREGSGAAGGAVTFTGTVGPSDAGATVILQRQGRSGAWRRIGHGLVDSEGAYSISRGFFRRGEATIRAVVHSHRLYVKSYSTPVTYQIVRLPKVS